MKRAILCAATLLLASGAWGQEKRVTLKAGDCATIHLTQHKDLTICAEKLPANQEKKAPPVLGNATVVDDLSYHIRWNGVEAVTVPCHDTPAKQEKKSPCSSNGVVTTCDAPAWMTKQEEKVPAMSSKGDGWIFTQEPFDIPPKESDAWEPPLENNWQELLGNGASSPCPEPFDFPYGAAEYVCVNGVVHYKVHHRTCADPKRVLLMSEDKVWHCYLFKEKP